jgi:hypothetical protein
VDFPRFMKILTKDGYMKKKLLVLLIAAIPMLMPNLVFAVAIDTEDFTCVCGGGLDCVANC